MEVKKQVDIPPLLSSQQVDQMLELLQGQLSDQAEEALLVGLPLDERIHILRFLSLQPGVSKEAYARILSIWRDLLPPSHKADDPELREALWRQSEWWIAPTKDRAETEGRLDYLETLLERVGHTSLGISYFQWVALHPPYTRMDDVWDEHRRGALTSIARYGYSRSEGSCEIFLARHLDDWVNIQTDVIDIFAAMKSRLIVKIGSWYIEHDKNIAPFIQEQIYCLKG